MVRRQSGPKLDVRTTDRGPAWFAPTPLTTRLTCSNMSRQNTSKPKAIIAHSVRSSAQIRSPWRTTNHAVPTKVHKLLLELLWDFGSHIYHGYLLHKQCTCQILSLTCCVSATTIAHSVQDKEFADSLIRSKLEMKPDTRLWCCKECSYNHIRHDVMKKHVDAQHMAIQYSCYICLKLSPTQHALKQHQASQHK